MRLFLLTQQKRDNHFKVAFVKSGNILPPYKYQFLQISGICQTFTIVLAITGIRQSSGYKEGNSLMFKKIISDAEISKEIGKALGFLGFTVIGSQ